MHSTPQGSLITLPRQGIVMSPQWVGCNQPRVGTIEFRSLNIRFRIKASKSESQCSEGGA